MAKKTIEDINLYIYSRLFAIVGQQINCFTSFTWGAFQKSELAGRTMAGPSHFDKAISFLQGFFLKNHLLRA